MSPKVVITPVRSGEDLIAVRQLFEEYAASLAVDLGYQDFSTELSQLPGRYSPPSGELLLARGDGGRAMGCIALRPADFPGCCEIKRLFLRPEARGLGLGKELAAAIIAQARERGYTEVKLDTLPTMASAIRLYEDMGFVRTAPYYTPTPPGTVFMALQI